jgi:hypothetical protein
MPKCINDALSLYVGVVYNMYSPVTRKLVESYLQIIALDFISKIKQSLGVVAYPCLITSRLFCWSILVIYSFI